MTAAEPTCTIDCCYRLVGGALSAPTTASIKWFNTCPPPPWGRRCSDHQRDQQGQRQQQQQQQQQQREQRSRWHFA
ncbi:hypothetical protein GPALN_004152 [Globodera pallida]|nr:hypothetical protein GPALN_004152 [Globodera pallida]